MKLKLSIKRCEDCFISRLIYAFYVGYEQQNGPELASQGGRWNSESCLGTLLDTFGVSGGELLMHSQVA